jgi:hypothetical protein
MRREIIMRVILQLKRRFGRTIGVGCLDLAEILEHRVDQLEGVVDLVSDFGASQDNLAANEDQKHDLRLDHAVDEAREQLRLVRAEVVVARSQTLQADGELDVTRTDNVLDLKVRELGVEACLKC